MIVACQLGVWDELQGEKRSNRPWINGISSSVVVSNIGECGCSCDTFITNFHSTKT
jgi:hypothetical protein